MRKCYIIQNEHFQKKIFCNILKKYLIYYSEEHPILVSSISLKKISKKIVKQNAISVPRQLLFDCKREILKIVKIIKIKIIKIIKLLNLKSLQVSLHYENLLTIGLGK